MAQIFKIKSLGIADIDAYGMVWYGNYINYYERACIHNIGVGEIIQIKNIKYKSSILWGEEFEIHSYILNIENNIIVLFQKILVGFEIKNYCITNFKVDEDILFDKIYISSNDLSKNDMSLIKQLENYNYFSIRKNEIYRLDEKFTVYPDSINGNYLNLRYMFDIFEQSRTKMIGGQEILKNIYSENISLVVARYDNLKINKIQIYTNDIIHNKTILTKLFDNKFFFEFYHEISKNNKIILSCNLLMCSINNKKKTFEIPPISVFHRMNELYIE